MAKKGGAIFLVYTDLIDDRYDEEFNAWYNTDHLPALLKLPGFLDAARYVAVKGGPKVDRSPLGKGYIKKPFVMTEGNIVLKGNIDGPGLGVELDDNLIDNERGIPEWEFPEMWDAAKSTTRTSNR